MQDFGESFVRQYITNCFFFKHITCKRKTGLFLKIIKYMFYLNIKKQFEKQIKFLNRYITVSIIDHIIRSVVIYVLHLSKSLHRDLNSLLVMMTEVFINFGTREGQYRSMHSLRKRAGLSPSVICYTLKRIVGSDISLLHRFL